MRATRRVHWQGPYRGIVCLVVLALLASGVLPTAGAEGPTLIVPGHSLGPAWLGMSVGDLKATLGPFVTLSGGRMVFPRWDMTATVQDGVAVRLSTTNKKYRTENGAGVGMRLGDGPRLLGDENEVVSQSGNDATILYPFQGVGFIFRYGQAAEVVVVERIPLGQSAAPSAPAAPEPGGRPFPSPPSEPQPSPQDTGTSGPSQLPPGAVSIRGLAETVNDASVLRITGEVMTSGSQRSGPVTLVVTFDKASGDQAQTQVSLAAAGNPGTPIPFGIDTSVATDPIVRYSIKAVAAPLSSSAAATPTQPTEEIRNVPPTVYRDLARRRVKVDVELGGPSNTSAMVQVLVSIASTYPIPTAWVRDVKVFIPYGSSGQEVHVAPGQTQTIFIPATPQWMPPAGGAPGTPTTTALYGEPKILDVTMGSP
jgi:hypothetical protein